MVAAEYRSLVPGSTDSTTLALPYAEFATSPDAHRSNLTAVRATREAPAVAQPLRTNCGATMSELLEDLLCRPSFRDREDLRVFTDGVQSRACEAQLWPSKREAIEALVVALYSLALVGQADARRLDEGSSRILMDMFALARVPAPFPP